MEYVLGTSTIDLRINGLLQPDGQSWRLVSARSPAPKGGDHRLIGATARHRPSSIPGPCKYLVLKLAAQRANPAARRNGHHVQNGVASANRKTNCATAEICWTTTAPGVGRGDSQPKAPRKGKCLGREFSKNLTRIFFVKSFLDFFARLNAYFALHPRGMSLPLGRGLSSGTLLRSPKHNS